MSSVTYLRSRGGLDSNDPSIKTRVHVVFTNLRYKVSHSHLTSTQASLADVRRIPFATLIACDEDKGVDLTKVGKPNCGLDGGLFGT